jgi:hypothetical protein
VHCKVLQTSAYLSIFLLVIAIILDDIQSVVATWGQQGTIDPFSRIDDVRFLILLIVYKMNCRAFRSRSV